MNTYMLTIFQFGLGLDAVVPIPFAAPTDLAAVEAAEARCRLLPKTDAATLETLAIGTYDPATESFTTKTLERLWDSTLGRAPKLGTTHRAASLAEAQDWPPKAEPVTAAEFGGAYPAEASRMVAETRGGMETEG